VWHRILHSCTHTATMAVKGLSLHCIVFATNHELIFYYLSPHTHKQQKQVGCKYYGTDIDINLNCIVNCHLATLNCIIGYVQNQTSDQSNLFKFVLVQRFTFRIKSRSARRHLRKIWHHGEIFVSHAHDDACDVNVANQ